ncbi:MAG: uroporphyrinogen decarboxylase family protein [Nitrososphaerota archaeon]
MREKILKLLDEAEKLNRVYRDRIEESRKRYEAAISFKEHDRPPVDIWVHGMSGWYLQGRYGLNMAEYFRNPEVQAYYQLRERIDSFKEFDYDSTGIWTGLSITGGVVAQASVIGARIVFPENDWPWIDTSYHPLDTPEKIDDFQVPDVAGSGIMPQIVERYEKLKRLVGDLTYVTVDAGDSIPVCILQMAVYARGYENLVRDMYTDPPLVHKLMRKMCLVGEAIHNFYSDLLECELSQLWNPNELYYDNFLGHFSPSLIRKFVLPYYREWAQKYGFKHWTVSSQCTLDPFIEIIAETPADRIPYLTSSSNLKLFKETFSPKKVWIRVAYEASLMLTQTPAEIEKECKRIMEIMAPGGGFIMSTACLDWKTPKKNIRAFINASKKYGKIFTKYL